ncbi:hypothetical protein F4861DRAFT_541119 [Xylaria intraflava]|nr:hypothetical protein F4861DRAFT_541119 [Xylaria intraflava]
MSGRLQSSAYRGVLSERPHGVRGANGYSCRNCYGRCASGFNPRRGEPIRSRCRYDNAGSLYCGHCAQLKDRCEPIPGLLHFEQVRVEELLQWGELFFDPVTDNDGHPVVEDGRQVYTTAPRARRHFAGAQLRLIRAFNHLVTCHRSEHELTLPVASRGPANAAYENMAQQRQTVRQAQVQPLAIDASAAVRAFLIETQEVCEENDMAETWAEIRPELARDVVRFD